MDIVEAIKTRKSVRGFKSDPVSKEVIREILEIAGRAPSAMNTQPWEFVVLTGEVLDKLRKANVETLHAGENKPEHTVTGWPRESIYRDRQVALAINIFELMDITREDTEKRGAWMERGFRFFDAPAAIILLTDNQLTEGGPLLDLGGVMQTICLAAMNYGLGTCIEDQGVMAPKALRELTNIADNKRIIMSIAIGYPNWDFPANDIETDREPIDNIITWYGFESK